MRGVVFRSKLLVLTRKMIKVKGNNNKRGRSQTLYKNREHVLETEGVPASLRATTQDGSQGGGAIACRFACRMNRPADPGGSMSRPFRGWFVHARELFRAGGQENLAENFQGVPGGQVAKNFHLPADPLTYSLMPRSSCR
jgi:hypothetical protein